MPATITHAYFAQDVYEILPSKFKDKLENTPMYNIMN